jgi:hypothetical protein
VEYKEEGPEALVIDASTDQIINIRSQIRNRVNIRAMLTSSNPKRLTWMSECSSSLSRNHSIFLKTTLQSSSRIKEKEAAVTRHDATISERHRQNCELSEKDPPNSPSQEPRLFVPIIFRCSLTPDQPLIYSESCHHSPNKNPVMHRTMTMTSFSFSTLSFLLSILVLCRHETTVAFSPDLPVILQHLHHHASLIQSTAASSSLSHDPLHIFSTATTNHLASTAVTTPDAFHPQEFLSSLYSKYRQALDAKPLQTKIMTGCTLAVVGDAIAQAREPADYNVKRAASFVAFDGCWRAVQVGTYKPLVATCTGQFSLNLLKQLPFLANQDGLQHLNPFLLGAMEQTLVSQLVLIPCTCRDGKEERHHGAN